MYQRFGVVVECTTGGEQRARAVGNRPAEEQSVRLSRGVRTNRSRWVWAGACLESKGNSPTPKHRYGGGDAHTRGHQAK